jgi:hypothetical protein
MACEGALQPMTNATDKDDFPPKDASLDYGVYGGSHDQKVARNIPTCRIISKKMMKIDGQFRVQYQCMPRFAV